ncbi:MAG: glycerophosphodiester phosphodiesterase family protein [Thermomicrobiales bacterium]
MTAVYAHRGDSQAYPENTLLAFQRAIESGAVGVELDLHATSDGVVVCIHDRSLERTTNGTGYVDEHPYAAVRELDAGQGELVPTFAEVLALVGDRLHFDLEVKQPGIEAAVLAVLAASPATRWAISSFDWEILRRLRALDAAAELWPLAEHVDDALLEVARELGSPAVAIAAGAYTSANAQRLKDAGLAAMVWTVNDPDEALRVRDLGAAALCTDVPGAIVALFAG